MADLIQIRRDSIENWTLVDPVLRLGEIGFVTLDGNMTNPIQFKVGNGSLVWSKLPLQYGSNIGSITVAGTTYYPDENRNVDLNNITLYQVATFAEIDAIFDSGSAPITGSTE